MARLAPNFILQLNIFTAKVEFQKFGVQFKSPDQVVDHNFRFKKTFFNEFTNCQSQLASFHIRRDA